MGYTPTVDYGGTPPSDNGSSRQMYFVAGSEFPLSLAMPSRNTRHAERAIISSSSVRMTRTATRLASVEITPAVSRVARLIQFDAEEAQPFTNASAERYAHFRRYLPRRRACPILRARRRRSRSISSPGSRTSPRLPPHARHRLPREQVPHVGTGLRNAEQPGLVVHHFVKLFCGHLLSSRGLRRGPGTKSPERVLITNPAVGVKPMLVSMLLPSRTAARLARR